MGRHLGCFIDEGLCIVLGEILNRSNHTSTREDSCDQGDAFVRDMWTIDQTLLHWTAAVHKELVRLTTQDPGWKLTCGARFATLLVFVDAGALGDPSSVGSMSITRL